MKALWGVSGLFLTGMYSLLLLPGSTFDAVIAEDSWVENLGALGLFVAGVVFASCFVRTLSKDHDSGSRWLSLSYLGLALLFFFGAGEEISWGQRIFGWATPAELAQVNEQHETNLHNLAGMHGWLDMGRLFQIFTFSFVLVVPLCAASSRRARLFFERLMPVVPWQLGMPFLANFLLSKVAETAAQAHYSGTIPLVQGVTELKETSYSVFFAAVAVSLYRRLRLSRIPVRAPVAAAA